jgi:dihydroorotate dehydrogenase electron transfer subunit
MQVTKITEIIKEAEKVKTFKFDLEAKGKPGQFVMVWVPGVDEKPMSLSYPTGKMGITVLLEGPFSKQLGRLNVGDRVGIRGPYGRGFRVAGSNLLLVGGGVGTAPLAPLAEKAISKGKKVTAVIGAKTRNELVFVERIRNAGARVFVTTDDGSEGSRGFTTDKTRELLEEGSFDQCYVCGPEIMMFKLLEQTKARGIPTQLSLVRYFKCGIGVCGHCALDYSGIRVCREGPVLSDNELEEVSEFGRYWRSPSGVKIYF